MDYNVIIKTLQEMKSRYADGFSTLDRAFLDKVYYDLFEREITNRGCSDCYRDAYMEINIKLNKDKNMPKKSDYKLKAGAVISFFGHSKAYTSANLTNEVAERYLAMNPNNAKLFAELPDDWRARVAAYAERTADPSANTPHMTEAEALEIIAAKDKELKEKDMLISERDSLIAELQSQQTAHALNGVGEDDDPSDKDLEIENLRMELGEANQQLASVTDERDNLLKVVENLRKENKGLKQSNSMLKKKSGADTSTDPDDAAPTE